MLSVYDLRLCTALTGRSARACSLAKEGIPEILELAEDFILEGPDMKKARRIYVKHIIDHCLYLHEETKHFVVRVCTGNPIVDPEEMRSPLKIASPKGEEKSLTIEESIICLSPGLYKGDHSNFSITELRKSQVSAPVGAHMPQKSPLPLMAFHLPVAIHRQRLSAS